MLLEVSGDRSSSLIRSRPRWCAEAAPRRRRTGASMDASPCWAPARTACRRGRGRACSTRRGCASWRARPSPSPCCCATATLAPSASSACEGWKARLPSSRGAMWWRRQEWGGSVAGAGERGVASAQAGSREGAARGRLCSRVARGPTVTARGTKSPTGAQVRRRRSADGVARGAAGRR